MSSFLSRELVKTSKLSEAKTHELIEIIEEMIKSKLNDKVGMLTWMVGIGLALIVALLGAVITMITLVLSNSSS